MKIGSTNRGIQEMGATFHCSSEKANPRETTVGPSNWEVWEIKRLHLHVHFFFSPIQSEVTLRKRNSKQKSKRRASTEMDSGYTTQRFMERLPSPRPLSDSECTSLQFFSVDESGLEATTGVPISSKSEGEKQVSSLFYLWLCCLVLSVLSVYF